ncbi:hypothetical protein BDN72DRAFT_834576 [Pluteus cervinus]|uniref:Uncharacterized protein n=1 Tax=Pluteus cervinus TaxID=181527 RepID=A0ACD3B6N0_9AGAR|nr:hypothetical protein BDN72DRAFT_834576 [Pluteus cervinus]
MTPLLKFPPPSAAGVLANRTTGNMMGNIMRGGIGHGAGPRSKFSVTSSEYPCSYHSSTYRSTSGTSSSPASSSDSEESIGSSAQSQISHQHPSQGQAQAQPPITPPVFVVDDCVSPAQLLSPAEFFTMEPTTRDSLKVSAQGMHGQSSTSMQGGRLRALPGSSLSTISEEMSASRSTLGSGPSYSNGRLGGN